MASISGASRPQLGSAATVTLSQLSLAAASYVVLAISGRALGAGGFATVTSFYLLVNTVGRGLCSATELHLTRAVAADLAVGKGTSGAARTGSRQTLALLGLALTVIAAGVPLLDNVFGGDTLLTVLLAATLPGMAWSYMARGRLAGSRRYGRYSLSFAVEAATTVIVGAVLLASGETSPRWWVLAFVLGPTVAVAFLLQLSHEAPADQDGTSAAVEVSGLAWSVVILGCSQAVWNLAPVILTARLSEYPTVAAGFAAVAVVLRIPILVFPAAQAFLLPILTAGESAGGLLRTVPMRWGAALGAATTVWLLASVFVVPPAVTLAFGSEQLPAAVSLLLLAGATLVGGLAQLAQTALIARNDYRRPAIVWTIALTVLLVICLVPRAGTLTSALALLAAVSVALLSLALPLSRSGTDKIHA